MSRARLVAPLWLILLPSLAGCAHELSRTEGVSITPCYRSGYGRHTTPGGALMQTGLRIPDVLREGNRGVRVISSVDLSRRYNIRTRVDRRARERTLSLQTRAFEQAFDLTIRRDKRMMRVDVLVLADARAVALTPSVSTGEPRFIRALPQRLCRHGLLDLMRDALRPYTPTQYTFQRQTMHDLARWLEDKRTVVTVDETGLDGCFDFQLLEDDKNDVTLLDGLRRLGFDLVPGERLVTAIYVDPAPGAEPNKQVRPLEDKQKVYVARRE